MVAIVASRMALSLPARMGSLQRMNLSLPSNSWCTISTRILTTLNCLVRTWPQFIVLNMEILAVTFISLGCVRKDVGLHGTRSHLGLKRFVCQQCRWFSGASSNPGHSFRLASRLGQKNLLLLALQCSLKASSFAVCIRSRMIPLRTISPSMFVLDTSRPMRHGKGDGKKHNWARSCPSELLGRLVQASE